MPGFNGTGPRGLGSMTGRGMGFCAVPVTGTRPAVTPYGYGNYTPGQRGYPYGSVMPYGGLSYPALGGQRFGMGFGRGLGRGFGRGGRGRGWGRGRGFGRGVSGYG